MRARLAGALALALLPAPAFAAALEGEAQRQPINWVAIAMFVAFVGYLALIAFDKALLGTPIGDGVTSIGIPIGLGLILLAIALTGLYVAYANRHHDAQMAAILKDHGA